MARGLAAERCKTAPDGWHVLFSEPPKTRIMEEKYHSMIGDIADQCKFIDRKWSREAWKRLLIDAFVKVMRAEAKANGGADPFHGDGEIVPSLDGSGIVQLGVQSRKFSKVVGSAFIEFLYAYGAENNVTWSEP